MSTSHINAKEGDFSNVVLMPGDPNRAKWIAENFLTDAKQVSDVRGILGYTGYTKNGKRLSVLASGMGMPSIGIYSYELFTVYNVDAIIRIGTCGAYKEKINLFDVIIASTASTDSNWSTQYDLLGTLAPGADFDLTLAAYNAAKENSVPVHVGNVLSADVFYDDNPDNWKKWERVGVLGVEMEAYALYCNAARLGKKALGIFTVTDHFVKRDKKATTEERVTSVGQMVEIAIKAAEQFIK